MNNCSVHGCVSDAKRRGLCNKHYLRNWRHGSPTAGAAERNVCQQWIDAHKEWDGDDCLIWPFGGKGNGYGHTRVDGHSTTAHRVMCVAAYGEPSAPELQALHSCGNGHKGCVNPRHLRWGTRLDNAADAMRHGTTQRGEKQRGNRLTETEVREIRQAAINGERICDLARKYEVSRGAIAGIVQAKTWKWLGVEVTALTSEAQAHAA